MSLLLAAGRPSIEFSCMGEGTGPFRGVGPFISTSSVGSSLSSISIEGLVLLIFLTSFGPLPASTKPLGLDCLVSTTIVGSSSAQRSMTSTSSTRQRLFERAVSRLRGGGEMGLISKDESEDSLLLRRFGSLLEGTEDVMTRRLGWSRFHENDRKQVLVEHSNTQTA